MSKYLSLKALLWLILIALWDLPALAQFPMTIDTSWVRRYNGSGNSYDNAMDVAVDDSGNVYVTGYSVGAGTSDDYATVKYNKNGTQGWIRRYDGGAGQPDQAYAIAVDDSSNTYVTGYSYGTGSTFQDYLTIKYDKAGNPKWIQRYNGTAGVDDIGRAIAVDDSGNVYVTGESDGAGSSRDYLTIKYFPSGAIAWTNRYNGTGNFYDAAFAIAVDRLHSVYVTGVSMGNGTGLDFVTIKYNPDSTTAWMRIYPEQPAIKDDCGRAIGVDVTGNVYVTGNGYDTTFFDNYATVSYDPSGTTRWDEEYDGGNGTAGCPDIATAIKVDESGNVYVTGQSSNGTNYDYATVKYDPNGNELWAQRYDGTGSMDDMARDLDVDESGNVYVTGGSANGTNSDYATVMYGPNGSQLCVKTYDGPGNADDIATAIEVDHAGSFYVTGLSHGIGTDLDYATIKYIEAKFLRGDINADGVIDVGDVVYLINYLYRSGPAPSPLPLADVNSDGVVDIGDVVYLINYLFRGGPPPIYC